MITRVSNTLYLLLVLVATLIGCDVSSASAAAPVIRTSPALDPAFNPSVENYVTRCDSNSASPGTVSVDVHAYGNRVSVDSSTMQTGTFDDSVSLAPGQGFTIVVGNGASSQSYQVRCLPSDFPAYDSRVLGPRQVGFILTTPTGYVAMFDSAGVPVWWYHVADGTPIDADLDPSGDLSWAVDGPGDFPFFGVPGAVHVEVRDLYGDLLNTLGTSGSPTDFHEAWPLANGDFLIDTYVPEFGVPVSIPGEPATVDVLDGGFQEVEPNGTVAYSWLSEGHVNPADSAGAESALWSYPGVSGHLWDWNHINAVMPYESGYLVSFRNTDAVYYIDASTGDVVWKLGGTYDPGESLTVENDPNAPIDLSSQHDVRVWPDGTISVFDNGTRADQAPRMARFSIDAAAGTATLVQSFGFGSATFSPFIGSARAIEPNSLSTSDWLIDWGGTPYITEQTPSGTPALVIDMHSTPYRAIPISTSQLTLSQLETAMNTMYGTPAGLGARALVHAAGNSGRNRRVAGRDWRRTWDESMPKHRRFPRVAPGASRRRRNDQNLWLGVLARPSGVRSRSARSRRTGRCR